MKKTLLFAIISLMAMNLSAQNWVGQGLGLTDPSLGVMNICVVNPQVVWLCVYDGSGSSTPLTTWCKTTDGGATWTSGSLGITGLSNSMITAVDANTAWLFCYKSSGSNNGGVFKTTDGGATWTRQNTALFSNANSFPDAIHFWNANEGWCMGDPINSEFEIYTTTDGGTTWVAVPGADIPNPVSGEYGYTSNCSAAGNSIYFGTNKGRVFSSHDKGHTWIVAAPTGWSAKSVVPAFRDSLNGIVGKYQIQSTADTAAIIRRSVDGGVSFNTFAYEGSPFTGELTYVPGTPYTYVGSGVNATYEPDRLGISYSFDDGNTWIKDQQLLGTQITAEGWYDASTAWVGVFTTGPTDGVMKFTGNLTQAIPDFETPDTLLPFAGSATFTNLSTGADTYLWNFQGGTPSSSNLETPPAILYTTPGTFDVSLTVSNGFTAPTTLTKTGYIHVGGVGVNNVNAPVVTVFPNPATDNLKINGNANIQEVNIYNLVGQLVYSSSVNAKSATVNVKGLTPGAYNVKVVLDNGSFNSKVIVK